jgi:N-acetylmuramoyl-L-alanine amidase
MKIAINAGHTKTGAGSGASYKGFNESDITRAVASSLAQMLRRSGHQITNANVDKAPTQNAYLRGVCTRANACDADLFISIHCNASATHLGKGVEAYTWKGRKLKQATNMCNNLAKLGFKNRGVKDGSKFYVIKHTNAKAILIELFFLDNPTDRALYMKHGADKIAEAIAKSI